MAADIEKVVQEFTGMLDSEDPVILQKLLIEVQIEAMRRDAYAMQDLNNKLGHMVETLDRMDWKLWELLKAANPEIDKGNGE
jgi:hypothetical protein